MSKMEYYEYLEEQGLETVQVSYEEWCMMKACEGPKQVDESSKTMCAACDIDLATCDTIFAAEGPLYCSRECGCHDFQYMNNFTVDEAAKYFNEVAEEINPQDIGLEYSDDVAECERCHELYETGELLDTDLGHICNQCVLGITSRGEEINIRYGGY